MSTSMSISYNTPDDIADYSDFEMPFGKHSGDPITEVPPQYLRWMYANCNFTYFPELQRAIESRLGLPPDPAIRTPTELEAQPPPQPPPRSRGETQVPRIGQSNGHPARPETGIDGF